MMIRAYEHINRHAVHFLKRLCVCLLPVGFIFFSSWAAFAELPQPLEVQAHQVRRIAFFPRAMPVYLYKDVPLQANYDVLSLKRAIRAHASSHPYLSVLSTREIESTLLQGEFDGIDAYHQAQADMGFVHNYMVNLNFDAAIVMLEGVLGNYQKSLIAYEKPNEMAIAWQQLAYAYVYKYQDAAPQEARTDVYVQSARHAFMELIRLAPYLTMLEGRQSAERVMLYDQALELFLSTPAYRRTPLKDASALSRKLNADLLVFARIIQTREAALKLELDLFRRDTQTMETRVIDLSAQGDREALSENFIDEATRALNDFYDCTPIAPPSAPKNIEIHAGIGLSYHSFLEYPALIYPHVLSADLQVSLFFQQYGMMRAGFMLSSILKDPAKRLYQTFQLYRFPIIVGMSYPWRFLRPFAGVGIEFQISSHYQIVNDLNCRVFGLDDNECSSDKIDAHDAQFGINVLFTAGMEFMFKQVSFSVEGLIGVTAYPDNSNHPFRYPVGGRMAISYHFY